MRKKVILLFLAVILVPAICIYVVALTIFSSESQRSLITQLQNNADAIVRVVEADLYELSNISLYPLLDERIYDFLLSEPEEVNPEILENVYEVLLAMPVSTSGSVRNVAVGRDDGTVVFTGSSSGVYSSPEREVITQKEYAAAGEYNGRICYIYEAGVQNTHITAVRQLKNLSNFDQSIGVMKLVFSTEALRNKLNRDKAASGAEYLLIDESGSPLLWTCDSAEMATQYSASVYSLKDTLSRETTEVHSNGESFFVTARPVSSTPFTLLVISKSDAVAKIRNTFLVGVSTAAVLALVFSFILSTSFSKIITSPIQKLERKMASVMPNDFSVRAEVKGHDEVTALTERFNEMMDRLDTAYGEVYQAQARLRDAQLLALQSQINPHFLYNTLDTIYWMSELGEQKNVSTMVSNLSSILHFTLSNAGLHDTNTVLLREELDHLRSYLYIIQTRFPDLFTFETDPVNELEDCVVLKLLLQPIVENAVNHGMKNIQHGIVRLRIFAENDQLVYEVSNNGIPINPNEIYALLQENNNINARGLALRNIHERLHLKYGTQAKFECYLQENFSTFRIVQPLVYESRKEENHDKAFDC